MLQENCYSDQAISELSIYLVKMFAPKPNFFQWVKKMALTCIFGRYQNFFHSLSSERSGSVCAVLYFYMLSGKFSGKSLLLAAFFFRYKRKANQKKTLQNTLRNTCQVLDKTC